MHLFKFRNTRFAFVLLLATVYTNTSKAQSNSLYEKIAALDSIFFTAYNNCDMATQEKMYSDSIEFYHDKSGLSTSKKQILSSTKRYICGKVSRQLVPGSIEVSPVPGYGAIEIGSHSFINKQEKDAIPHPSKFVIIWRNKNNNWQITKVISLH